MLVCLIKADAMDFIFGIVLPMPVLTGYITLSKTYYINTKNSE
jgi:hypothetical protein